MCGLQTECACLQFADSVCDTKYTQFRKENPESSFVKVCVVIHVRLHVCERVRHGGLQVFPFSSAKKYMMTVVRVGSTYRLYIKGAPEVLLPHCTSLALSGSTEQIFAQERVCFGIEPLFQGALC